MSDTTTQVAQAIANRAAGISGMFAASAFPVDAIPDTPYTVVGPHTGTLPVPGSWEQRILYFPVRCYVSRTAGSTYDQQSINAMVDAFISAFRSGITDSAGVTQIIIQSWNTGLFEVVANEEYQVIDFTFRVDIFQSATYTA